MAEKIKWLVDETKLKNRLHREFDPINAPDQFRELVECTGYCAIDIQRLDQIIEECRVFFAKEDDGPSPQDIIGRKQD